MDMNNEISELLDVIRADYLNWSTRLGDRALTAVLTEMVAEFNTSLSVKPGIKYIKIIQRSSVWGFIVATDEDPKFKKGDILKAATWAAPARNQARGNILTGGYTVQWTGPLYL